MSKTTSSPAPASSTASASDTTEESTPATSSSSTKQETTSETPSEQETQETPDAPETDEQDDEQAEADPRVSEARKYRKRAQQAEQERDDLRAQLDQAQGTADDRVNTLKRSIAAAQVKATAGVGIRAFDAVGIDLAALVGDDGQVDQQATREALNTVHSEFGIRAVGIVPTQGTGSAAPRAKEGHTWSDALAGVRNLQHPEGGLWNNPEGHDRA